MAESIWNVFRRMTRIGRRRKAPERETEPFPRTFQLGMPNVERQRPTYKPVARNLRYFSKTPYARRAINAIKDPITNLPWEIVPLPGVDWNSELKRQAEVATYCFDHPNHEDSFATLAAQVVEDILCGGGAIETQTAGDEQRPLWMWPVDGLSIQIFALWDGDKNEPHYFQTYGYGSLGNLGAEGVPLRDDELIYIKPNPTTADPFGTGPLEIAFMTISRQLGVSDFAGLLASNARPTTLLFFEGMDSDKLAAFREYWRNVIEGRGEMPIVGGKKAEAVSLRPEGDKALFLEWQEFLIREIGTSFDLSPQNFGIERDVNRNTSEVAEDRDWDQAIKPRAYQFAAYLTRHALHRRLGFSQLMFKFIGLDREDEEATAKIYETYYKANAITPNEQREKLGLAPMDNEWGERTAADVEIAISLARGAKEDTDSDLPKPRSTPASKAGKKGAATSED